MTPADVEKLTNEHVKKAYNMNTIHYDDRKRIQETMTLDEAQKTLASLANSLADAVQSGFPILNVPEESRDMAQKILDERKAEAKKLPQTTVVKKKQHKHRGSADSRKGE